MSVPTQLYAKGDGEGLWAAEDPTFCHLPKPLEEGKGWNKILGCKILGFYAVLSYISFFFGYVYFQKEFTSPKP